MQLIISLFLSAICRDKCQHGHCLNQPGQCICHSGWTGENCEVPIKRLISTTKPPVRCQNGGQWTKSACQCPKEFRGEFCEERICFNGGLSSSDQCICPPGYEGKQCQLESTCPICRNNGRCEDKKKCQCPKEFIGQYCEIDIRLIEKKEKKIISLEFFILFFFLLTFLLILIILSYIFYKYSHRRQQQLQQLKQINLDKVWTVEQHSINVFKETNEKLPEKKDINLKLKQTDIQASLV